MVLKKKMKKIEIPESTRIKLLVCGDIHASKDSIEKFREHYEKTKMDCDLVILTGDFSNITPSQQNDPAEKAKAKADLEEALTFFANITKKPVVYVPGNHEADEVYEAPSPISSGINLHKGAVQVGSLGIFGFGGAIPCIRSEGSSWIQVYEGYPYKSDEDFTKEIIPFVDSFMEKASEKLDLIFLTHIGPWNCDTTLMFVHPFTVFSGSKGLATVMEKYNARILCNIHGHAHTAQGLSHNYPSSCSTINPGAFTRKQYSEIILEKNVEGRWSIGEVTFKFFQSLFDPKISIRTIQNGGINV